jgi:hypothetical protein
MKNLAEERIAILKSELDALKQQRKADALAIKKSKQWVKVKNTLPDANTKRAIVWSNRKMYPCWFSDGKWYAFNGTWMLTKDDVMDVVSHWMPTDWMNALYWPQCGPGIVNRLRYLWQRVTDKASDMTVDLRPKRRGNAQLGRKPVFYTNSLGEITSGMPENVPVPRGYEKVVCNSVQEAEHWSERQRQWERVKHGKIQEDRQRIEEPIHQEIRSEMHNRMSNARNSVNREFMRRAIETSDAKHSPWKYDRESYLHSEAFEDKR